jgi:hypothetical protein
MQFKKASIYALFLFSIPLGTIALAEFVILPFRTGLPRDILLMGFAATPHTVVDDTPINAMGFTGDVIDVLKPPGTIRILTLGGSTMFNRRMTARLSNRFKAISTRHIEVVGAALRAHTSMSSVLKYRLLSKYHFDFVLINEGINDLWANDVAFENFKDDYSHLDAWYKRNFCLDHSLVCRSIYNKLIYHKPKVIYQTAFKEDLPAEKIFRHNLITLIRAIQQNGATPILMTFAWSVPDNYTLEAFQSSTMGYNNPTKYNLCPVELWGSLEYVRDGLQEHNKVVRQLANTSGVLLIDQERFIGKDPYWFGDVCHFSEEGTDRFIDHVVEFFVTNGLLRPSYTP